MPEYTLHDYDDDEAKQPAGAGRLPPLVLGSSHGDEVDQEWKRLTSTRYQQENPVLVAVNMARFAKTLASQKKQLVALCERAKGICLGDAEPFESDDWVTDFNAFLSENSESSQPKPK